MSASESGQTRRHAPDTVDRLLTAALTAFAGAGFHGTAVRQIERMANVERGLAGYHFGSRQNLWNRTVNLLFDMCITKLENLGDALRDVSKRERAGAMLKAYARFNAEHPELFRIIVIDGRVPGECSERLAYHLRRTWAVFTDLTELSQSTPTDTTIRWLHTVGAAGAPFAMSVHIEQTFGAALGDPEFVDRFATGLAKIALGTAPVDSQPERQPPGLMHFVDEAQSDCDPPRTVRDVRPSVRCIPDHAPPPGAIAKDSGDSAGLNAPTLPGITLRAAPGPIVNRAMPRIQKG